MSTGAFVSRCDPHASRTAWRRVPLGLSIAWLALLAGCQRAPVPAPELPPPTVVVAPAESRIVDDEETFVGRVVAVNRVDLRARVSGFLKERLFVEGDTVAVGDPLFTIEPDQFEAIVAQRQADLAKALADQQNTGAQLRRGKELLVEKNIAQSKVDELQATDSMAQAMIAQARAALAAAELDLSYTRILAPVAGRIGLAKYTVGTLVGPESGTLATIVSRDPIYVQFPLTQRELLAAREQVEARGGNVRDVPVRVRLPNAKLYDQSGHLDFVDVTTDVTTDTVTLRAVLPNPAGILVDNQYVGVLVQAGNPEPAILIPQSALQIDQQGVFAMIVDAAGKAQARRIETGAARGMDIVVTKGLAVGEAVIAQGVQKVRPGQLVKATPASSLTDAADRAAASPAPASATNTGAAQ